MKTIEFREKQLRDRLNILNKQLNAIEDTLEQPANADVEERSVEREEDEVLEGLGNADLLEVRMIEAALNRISEGEYGVCVSCGEKISEERLDVLPSTPMCHKCAS